MNQDLRVNKPSFHLKGFALGLGLKQRRKATREWAIQEHFCGNVRHKKTSTSVDKNTVCNLSAEGNQH